MSPARLFSLSAVGNDLVGSRPLRSLIILLLIFELYGRALLPALIGIEKAREQKSVADYAHGTEAARAELTARKADVEKAKAAASDLFKASEARAASAQADINREEQIVREAEAREADRLQAAVAENARLEAALSQGASLIATGTRRACLICFIRQ